MSVEFPAKFNIFKNIPASKYTKINIGGKADYLAIVSNQDDFVELFRCCRQKNIRLRALGHGSNVFFSDKGFRGLIAIVNFNKLKMLTDNTIIVDAGVSLASLTELCTSGQLTGFEFASGIPGTVGGAIYGNAGAYGKAIGDCLRSAKILFPNGKVSWVDANLLDFSYRYSNLKNNQAILLEAKFQFQKGEPAAIKKRVAEILELRRQKLPPDRLPTAGSYFKNIKDEYGNPTAAAKYLESVGSKKISVGDAAVYHNHANIFFNNGKATAADVLKLEAILKKKVFDKFGVQLEREVIYIEER